MNESTQKQGNAEDVKLTPDLKWTEDVTVLGEQLSKRLTGLQNLRRDGTSYYIGMVLAGNPEIQK